jgi:uncharacterized protein (TIGR03382 family)
MAFASVAAVEPCVQAACQNDCAARAAQQQWPAMVCTADPPVDPPDAGADAQAPGAVVIGRPVDAATQLDASDVPRPHAPTGCSCATAPAAPGVWALFGAWPLLRRRRPR